MKKIEKAESANDAVIEYSRTQQASEGNSLTNTVSDMENSTDRIESIAEEIRMFTGLNVSVKGGDEIEVDTLAGVIKYSPSEKTVMGDVYRFISHYGTKLHSWGLKNKLTLNNKSV